MGLSRAGGGMAVLRVLYCVVIYAPSHGTASRHGTNYSAVRSLIGGRCGHRKLKYSGQTNRKCHQATGGSQYGRQRSGRQQPPARGGWQLAMAEITQL